MAKYEYVNVKKEGILRHRRHFKRLPS